MKRNFLLIVSMLVLTLTASAQSNKVRQLFRVTDPTFNVNFGKSSEPLRNDDGTFIRDGEGNVMRGEVMDNEANPLNNSFTLNAEWATAAWEFGGPFWEHGVDWSAYDKLVLRISSVVGNNLNFSIWDYASLNEGNSPDDQFLSPDNIVEFDEEQEFEFDLKEGLDRLNGNGQLDLTDIKQLRFWNYWDVHGELINPEEQNYDPDFVDEYPGAAVTVTISAMYLERTLANGEKDYLDLLTGKTIEFTDEFLNEEEPGSASYIDNTGVMHMNENAEAGLFFDDEPANWTQYKYLVIVPQAPWEEAIAPGPIAYKLTDIDDNVFDSGSFRWFVWNRPRCAVQDLTAITETMLDDETYLENFDVSQIASLKFSRWGGVSTWEYGIAGVWLTNTCPTYSTGFGEGTDQTGDYIIENASENTVMTICLPFAAALCGAQVYTVAGIDNPDSPSELYAAPYYGILEAGKPYIIRTNSARNVTAFRAGANEVAEPEANGALVADEFITYYVEADKNYLVLNEDGDTFTAVSEDDIRVNSNTAYIDCSRLAKAEEPENGLVFAVSGAAPFTPVEDGVRGIENGQLTMDRSAQSDASHLKNAVYDLSGRKIVNRKSSNCKLPKGVYMKNGSKFIVK